MWTRREWTLAAVCAAASSACRRSGPLRLREVHLNVELDAFSGRPNPRWELSAEQASEYRTRFGSLGPAASPSTGGDGLGYRGFIVRANGEEARFYRGIAVVNQSGRQEVFADPSRALEHWLLETARPHVDAAVMTYIAGELK